MRVGVGDLLSLTSLGRHYRPDRYEIHHLDGGPKRISLRCLHHCWWAQQDSNLRPAD
jgi:hypothetical protein